MPDKRKSIMEKVRRIRATQKTSPIWLTVMSDLMTNLTLFFMLMYAFTRLTADEREEISSSLARAASKEGVVETRARDVLHKLSEQETMAKIDRLAQQKELEKYAKLDISEQMIKITLTAPVLFDTGESTLKKEAVPILNEVARVIAPIPNDIVVEGHTDNVPISAGAKYKSNWELSNARAFSVIDYFVEEKGVNPERLVSAGFGEHRPVAPNDTDENKAKNRRIEINIIRVK
ncbi:MAG: flagellar motor protein MotB [Elusimicrobiota bacterium]